MPVPIGAERNAWNDSIGSLSILSLSTDSSEFRLKMLFASFLVDFSLWISYEAVCVIIEQWLAQLKNANSLKLC
ncbi:hypothetical protein PRIPAC_80782 [Pristionchus pacificus]|uniref:Uncharacterized protein n=1 Tax=Pristionchus pacificus TaxID=54126 RepID=A0A2A6CMG9_PRIPA|nr:hypothetical protein PRIPAC_80782 [Pristionchus pacificus]|eukprot:PDM79221.1 hypothetical protein PRIPAC_31800 [Pristionchus pacificus]